MRQHPARRARAPKSALVLLFLAGACTSPDPQTAAPAESTAADPTGAGGGAGVVAFVDVDVIPMDRERVLPGQTVLVRDGRIEDIAPTDQLDPPADATVVQGRGRFLMPGLAEMHAHIPPGEAGEDEIQRTLDLYLAGGVTTVRGMLGHPRHLELRAQAQRGEILSPRIFTSGPSFNGNSVQAPADAVRMVDEQQAAGYDFLKIHPGVSRAAYDSLAAAADRQGMPFAGHVPADVGLRRVLEAGQATIDHLDGYAQLLVPEGAADRDPGLFGVLLAGQLQPDGIPALAEATREAGVWQVPTQSLMENLAGADSPEALADRPEMRWMPRQTVEQWTQAAREFRQQDGFTPELGQHYLQTRRELIRELHRAGVGMLLGSDAPQIFNVPGFALERELAYLVDAGLTPFQALETGTRRPAEFFGELENWGTVEEGKAADLILLDANPLEDIDNIARRAGVMVRGRWIPQEQLLQRLQQ